MRLRRKRGDAGTAAIDPISQNIDAVVALHAFAEQQVDTHQRTVEALTAWLGRPQFFYGILVGVCLWMGVNATAPYLHFTRWDDPPFAWLQGVIGLGALLMTSVILITQNRQGKLAERREQLELQMSLLSEQRTAKIIDLLEELRRDMPSVRNRIDLEAEALTKTVDPHEVLATLESKLEQTLEALGSSDEASRLVAEEMDAAAAETQEEIDVAKHAQI
ncbi:MAG: DUF1003 domain-containing protein [Janthinobacterium lividum]